MANVDILRMNIYRSNWSSGRFVKSRCLLWTEHQCCGCKNSKPPFSTNIRSIYVQHSIRCTRDQCRHFEYRYSQNEHILIKLVIKMCKISVLVDCCMTSIPNHLSPPIQDRFLSSKVFDVHEIKIVMNNVDILRTTIYWSMEASGWVKFSDACGLIILSAVAATRIPNHLSPPI